VAVNGASPPVEQVIRYLSATWLQDRNEVENRLLTLLVHLLSWARLPSRHSRNWQDTIERHAERLRELLAMPRKHFADDDMENQLRDRVERWPLKDEAAAMLERVYAKAIRLAIAKTGMRKSLFSDFCPYSLEEIMHGTEGLEPIGEEWKKKRR
jgi:hypothetical protein